MVPTSYGATVTIPLGHRRSGARASPHAPTPRRAPLADVGGHWGSVDAPAVGTHTHASRRAPPANATDNSIALNRATRIFTARHCVMRSENRLIFP